MINKHILCRIGVSVASMAMILIISYLIFTNKLAIVSFLTSAWFAVTLTTIVYVALILVSIVPLVTLNWAWYEEESKTEHIIINEDVEDLGMWLTIFGGVISCATLLVYLIGAFSTVNTNVTYYLNTNFPYVWVPGLILIINMIFIGVYYKVGKKVCKVIYGEKG